MQRSLDGITAIASTPPASPIDAARATPPNKSRFPSSSPA